MPVADIILENASLITMAPAIPPASAVAVRGGRILALGETRGLRSLAGKRTKIIDCQGKTVVPGFIDAHCHLFSFIRQLLSLDLSPEVVKSIAEIKDAVKKRAARLPAGAWLSGTGLRDFYLAEQRLPTRQELDEAAPLNPVVLAHAGLHQAVLNSRALALAGIRKGSILPGGATAELDAAGEPNGRVHELLGHIREQVMPPLSEGEIEAGMALVSRHYLSVGITSIGEATVVNNPARFRILRRFKDNNALVPRVYFMFGYPYLSEFGEAGLAFRSGDDALRLGGVKIIVTESTGTVFPAAPALAEMVRQSELAGFPVAIHAIQARSVLAAIAALEKTAKPELRHRIEHCLECPPEIMERLSRLKPIVVTQPAFLYYGGDRTLATQPEQARACFYRFRSLNDSLTLAGSSDSPVSGDHPMTGIYAAVTRKTQTGGIINAAEAVSAFTGLKMYTANAAYASGDENSKGSLTPGKLADLVVLDANPLTVPAAAIKDIKVLMTIVAGQVVWES